MFPKETKILIVDDMLTMRKIVKKCVAGSGLTNIIEADDGETAWAQIEKSITENSPVEVVLSDWNMPKMKGIDLLRKVRGHEKLKNIPFILITAESEKTQVAEAVGAGVTGYLVKPFTQDQVTAKLKEAFAKK